MSVFIKGFDKPKDCFGCDFNMYDCYCKINNGGIDRDFWYCDIECPIVEVPTPHGRLIDADALDKRVRQAGGTADAEVNCTEDFNDGILFVLDYFVKSMQTVIEAEVTE